MFFVQIDCAFCSVLVLFTVVNDSVHDLVNPLLFQESPPPEPAEPEKPKPFKLEIKKKEKKELPPEPEAEPIPPEEMFKLPQKKKSSVTRKITPKVEEPEQPAFAEMKLRKSSIVKRTWKDEKMELVDLKHHEFEEVAQEEEAEKTTGVTLSEPIIDKDVNLTLDEEEKQKKKKKKKVRPICLLAKPRPAKIHLDLLECKFRKCRSKCSQKNCHRSRKRSQLSQSLKSKKSRRQR